MNETAAAIERVKEAMKRCPLETWTVEQDDRPGMEWNRHIHSDPSTAVCFMAHSDGASPERDEANAALVAAAPDLLDALHVFAERSSSDEVITITVRTEHVQRARAAIAKATGSDA